MLGQKFKKGHKHDAGYDILLDEAIMFPPMSTVSFELDHVITPKKGTCAMLIARTSAAKQGLIISMCPIDADYTGKITAIVFNASKKPITYQAGQSFCQAVFVKLGKCSLRKDEYFTVKLGKRGRNKFGSTGK